MPTQNTDVFAVDNGIIFTAPNQKWKVANGVDVIAGDAGVFSEQQGSKLVNKGWIYGGEAGGIFDAGGGVGNYVLKNKAGAEMIGGVGFGAVDFTGSLMVRNDGGIRGLEVGLYSIGSSNVEITNHGDITGIAAAIYAGFGTAGSSGAMVDNSGNIGGQLGILFVNDLNILAKITNRKGGVIEGTEAAIVSEERVKVKNDGKIKGDVFTADHDDKVINKSKIKGDVWLGDGNDVYKSKNKAKAGMIDTREGNDKAVLGVKADKLLFDTALNATTNVDTVKKFEHKKDMMYLDQDIFSTIAPGQLSSSQFHKGTAAVDADDRIIYDRASGALYYDPDGTGILGQTQFAQFDPGTKVKADNFMIGEYSIATPSI